MPGEISSNGDAWSLLDCETDTIQLAELLWSDNFIRNLGTNPAVRQRRFAEPVRSRLR